MLQRPLLITTLSLLPGGNVQTKDVIFYRIDLIENRAVLGKEGSLIVVGDREYLSDWSMSDLLNAINASNQSTHV
jgi:hypothetical protein